MGEGVVLLSDINGALINAQPVTVYHGNNNFYLDCPSCQSGLYYVTLKIDGSDFTVKQVFR